MRILIILLLLAGGALISWTGSEVASSPYRFSGSIKQAFASDTSRGRTDLAAYAFSYIGEYEQALTYFDKGNPAQGSLSGKDSLYVLALKPLSARKYILQQARKERIIMINEAHHNPLHRVFTASLLADLYRLGFRYFGAETLSHYDSTLNERKYPVLESGYYSKEPQYGNLLREALTLGFRVFPYDVHVTNPKEREIGQARNIQKLLRQDPSARILIHCGYAHVYEAPLRGNWEKAMAGRVKEFTGIDPFTIDQERWTEKATLPGENPAYGLLQIKQASVFTTPKEEVFSAFPGTEALTDIRVAHPENDLPLWPSHLAAPGGKVYPLFSQKEQLTSGFPCLVLAYKASEPAEGLSPLPAAIPVDVIELQEAREQKALILPPGQYQLVVKNEQGQSHTFRVFH